MRHAVHITLVTLVAVVFAPFLGFRTLARATEDDVIEPRLRIRVVLPESISVEEADLTAWLDGSPLGDLPGEFSVEPGEHVLTVKQHEALVAEGSVTVAESGITALVARFGALRVDGHYDLYGSMIKIGNQLRGKLPATLLVPTHRELVLRLPRARVPVEKPPGPIELEPGELQTVYLKFRKLYFDVHGKEYLPSFDDPGIDRVDWIIYETTFYPTCGFSVRLFTYTWDYVRLTPVEMGWGFSWTSADFKLHVGPTIGFGSFFGPRKQFGLWVFSGLWFGMNDTFTLDYWSDVVENRYMMVEIPVGIEFAHHFGRYLDWVWGIRAYGAFSVWGTRRTLGSCSYPEHHDPWYDCYDSDPASMYKAGIGLFIGF